MNPDPELSFKIRKAQAETEYLETCLGILRDYVNALTQQSQRPTPAPAPVPSLPPVSPLMIEQVTPWNAHSAFPVRNRQQIPPSFPPAPVAPVVPASLPEPIEAPQQSLPEVAQDGEICSAERRFEVLKIFTTWLSSTTMDLETFMKRKMPVQGLCLQQFFDQYTGPRVKKWELGIALAGNVPGYKQWVSNRIIASRNLEVEFIDPSAQ